MKLRAAPLSLLVGVVIVGSFVVVGLLAIAWTPHDTSAVNVLERLQPPGTPGHALGTDLRGRDVVSVLMAGTTNSLLVSVLSTSIALTVGVVLGLLAAGAGRLGQDVLNRLMDVGLALPALLIALVLVTATQPGRTAVVLAIVISFIPWAARITVGPARQQLALDYVQAAAGYGRHRWYILRRHVLPNIAPAIIVQGSIMFATAILAEASLSFLGLGAPPPTQTWGRLLNESSGLIVDAPTLIIFPGIAITLTVLGFNLLGNGLQTALDPHRQQLSPAGGAGVA